jgi:hypothetical protein
MTVPRGRHGPDRLQYPVYFWLASMLLDGTGGSSARLASTVIGSDIYNTVTRYYIDKYYEAHKHEYRYFAMFESHIDDDKRRIVIREEGGQQREDARFPGKAFFRDARGEPAIIMRIKDKGASGVEESSHRPRTVLVCAGLTHISTAAAVIYLCERWQSLQRHFGEDEFAVVLYCRPRQDEPTDIRQLEAGRFFEQYTLEPSKEST